MYTRIRRNSLRASRFALARNNYLPLCKYLTVPIPVTGANLTHPRPVRDLSSVVDTVAVCGRGRLGRLHHHPALCGRADTSETEATSPGRAPLQRRASRQPTRETPSHGRGESAVRLV